LNFLFALKIPAALAFWFIGRWIIGRVVSVMRAALNRNHVDPTPSQIIRQA
jgi:small conductance mechanosensitive channel